METFAGSTSSPVWRRWHDRPVAPMGRRNGRDEVAVETTDANGSRRDVVRAHADQVRGLAPLASEPASGLILLQGERVLAKVSRPAPFAEVEGYNIWESIHDVPEGTKTAMCRAYAADLSGGPAMGYTTPAPVETLTAIRDVVANVARTRDTV